MSIYESIQANAYPTRSNAFQALEQLKSNPLNALKMRGLNIPAGMTNPEQIIQHLVTSGQIPNARYQQALQMMRR